MSITSTLRVDFFAPRHCVHIDAGHAAVHPAEAPPTGAAENSARPTAPHAASPARRAIERRLANTRAAVWMGAEPRRVGAPLLVGS